MACTSDFGPGGPARLDLDDIYRGDTFRLVVEMVNDDGTPRDIDGCSYSATIKQTRDSTTSVAFSLSVDEGTATVTLVLTPTQTAGSVPRRGIWDLQETCGSTVTTLMAGDVRATDDVT